MKIVLLVEGKTEMALRTVLKAFLDGRADTEERHKVALQTKPMDTRLLNSDRVKDQVALSLRDPKVECVVGLIDVYPNFTSAQEAKQFLRSAVGPEKRFHSHAAQFDVEAWLLPFWDEICKKLRVKRQPPGGNPEEVDLGHPPSRHLAELYRLAKRSYDKPRDALAILQGKDLTVSASRCPEFKAFLNTLLICANLAAIP